MNIKAILNFKPKFFSVMAWMLCAVLLSGCYNTAELHSALTGSTQEHESVTVKVEIEETATPKQMPPYSIVYTRLDNTAIINRPINLCERADILYVKIHNHSSLNSDKFADIVMTALQNNQLFDEVVTRRPTIYVNVEPEIYKVLPNGEVWYDMDDPLTIKQIRELYPRRDVLILEVRMQEFKETDPLVMSAKLIDAKDGSSFVVWRNKREVWYWIDDSQTASMMQGINTWFNEVAMYCQCECVEQ